MRATYSTSITPVDVLGALNDLHLKYAPRKLHLASERTLLRYGPRVSLIGSWNASPEVLRRTRVLAASLIDVVGGRVCGEETDWSSPTWRTQ